MPKHDINKQIFIKIYIKICHRNHRIVKLCYKSSRTAPFVPQANHLASFIDRYVISSVTLGAILPPPSKTMKSSICPTIKCTVLHNVDVWIEAFLSFHGKQVNIGTLFPCAVDFPISTPISTIYIKGSRTSSRYTTQNSTLMRSFHFFYTLFSRQ